MPRTRSSSPRHATLLWTCQITITPGNSGTAAPLALARSGWTIVTLIPDGTTVDGPGSLLIERDGWSEAPWWRTMFNELDPSSAFAGDYWSRRSVFGQRPAAVAAFPTACGPSAWEAMPAIGRVVDLASVSEWPIVYTTGLPGGGAFGGTVKGDRAVTTSTG